MKEQEQVYRSKAAQADSVLSSKTLLLDNYDDLSLEEREIIKREVLEKEKEFYNVERNKLLVMSNNYLENNPKQHIDILIAKNDRYENIIQGMEDKIINTNFLSDKGLGIEEIDKKTYINNYIIENEIQPILSPYTMTGANSLVMFLEGNNLIILIFVIALLSIDIYLSEVEEGSYKLAYTQPITRKQIYTGKLITITVISLAVVLLGILLNFMLTSIVFEKGNLYYPFITNDSINTISLNGGFKGYKILQLWKYFIMGIQLLVPIILFTISLIIFLSIFTDSNSNTLGFTMMFLVLSFIFNSFLPKESIINLIYPYSYLFVKDVIEINNSSHYLIGYLINFFLSILLFVFSYYKFMKKDFLGARE
nr:ABC transporter permease subunit [Tissierella sp.]